MRLHRFDIITRKTSGDRGQYLLNDDDKQDTCSYCGKTYQELIIEGQEQVCYAPSLLKEVVEEYIQQSAGSLELSDRQRLRLSQFYMSSYMRNARREQADIWLDACIQYLMAEGVNFKFT